MSLSLPMTRLITSLGHENPFDLFSHTESPASEADTHPMLKELLLDIIGTYDTFEYLDPYDTYNLRGDYNLAHAIDSIGSLQLAASRKDVHVTEVLNLEDFFFMSPFSDEGASRQYFEDCIAWVERYFAGQVLSAIVFVRDEMSYCFVLAKFVCNPLEGHTVFALLKPLFRDEVLAKYEIASKSVCSTLS